MGNKVTLVRQDGTRIDATPEQADKLKLLGYKPEDVDTYVARENEEGKARYYEGQKISTAVEGALRGVTLGVSDYVLDNPEAGERAKYNPGTAMVSEIGGALLPAMLSGGETAAASVARATPVGLLARGAEAATSALGFEGATGRIVKGGLEGAAFGAAQTGDHAYLSGDKLTSEAVLHGIGWGTLFGAGLSAAGEGLSGLGKRAEARVAAQAVEAPVVKPGALSSVAKDSYTAFKTEADNLSKSIKEATATVDAVMSGSNRKFGALRQRIGEAANSAERAPVTLGHGAEAIEDVGGDFTTGVRDAVGSGDFRPSVRAGAAGGGDFSPQVKAEVGPYTSEPGDFAPDVKAAARGGDFSPQVKADVVGGDFSPQVKARYTQGADFSPEVRAAAGPGADFAPDVKAAARGGEFSPEVKAAAGGGPGGPTGPVTDAELAVHMKAIRSAYGKIGKAAGAKTGAAAKVAAAKDAYQQTVAQVSARLGLSTGEGGISTAMTELVEMKEVQKVLSGMPHTIEQFASMTEARAENMFAAMERAKRLSSFPVLAKSVDEAAGKVSAALGVDVGGVDGLRATWRAAKESIKAEKLAALKKDVAANFDVDPKPNLVARMAGKAAGGYAALKTKAFTGSSTMAFSAYGAVNKLVSGTLSGAGLSAARNEVVGRLNMAAASYLPKAGRALQSVAPKIEPLAVKLDGTLDMSTRNRQTLAKARLNELGDAAPHVNDTLYRGVSGIGVTQPALAPGMHQAAVGMFESLRGMMPADPGVVSGLKSIWNPSDLQIAVMGRQYEVFHNAVGVAERMLATGNFDPISIKAMKELTPAVYRELRSALLDHVTVGGMLDHLNYGQQIGLSSMLDIPLHTSMRPEFIASSLQLHAKRRELLPTPGHPGADGGGKKSPQDTPGATPGNILGG